MWKFNKGFTQLELVIALAVLNLAVLCGAGALSAGWKRLEQLYEDAAIGGGRRLAAAVMGRDLRCAVVTDDSPPFVMAGRPDGDNGHCLDFARPAEAKDSGVDVMEIGYSLERDASSDTWNLVRRRQARADRDPLEGGEQTILCRNVERFRVRYFDGRIWSEDWGWDHEAQRPIIHTRGLPLLISIEIDQSGYVLPVMTSALSRRNARGRS